MLSHSAKLRVSRFRRRAFTLFELLAAVSLLLVVLGISLTALRRPTRAPKADSAGRILQSAMLSAQAQAQAKNMPVAIALATDSQQAAHGFYRLEGHDKPRIVSVTDLRKECPGIYLANVIFGSNTSQDETAVGESFLTNDWMLPRSTDPTIIFLPSGKVASNMLAHEDGKFHFVLGEGLNLSSGLGLTARLDGANEPQTLSVSTTGQISLQKGVPGHPHLVISSAVVPTSGNLPDLSQPSTDLPEILSVKVLPERTDATPDTVEVPLNGSMSLSVQATSPSGEDLYATWSGDGHFSSDKPVPMEWRPKDQVWRGESEWKAPVGANPGDELRVQVEVTDRYGRVATTNPANPANVISLEVTEPSNEIVFIKRHDNISTAYRVFDDGTGEKELWSSQLVPGKLGSVYQWPRWSPDGSKLAVVHYVQTSPTNVHGGSSLHVALQDIGPARNLIPSSDFIYSPRWSPDGTKLAVLRNPYGARLTVMNLAGDVVGEVANTPTLRPDTRALSWAPDNRRIVFSVRENATQKLGIFDCDTGNLTTLDTGHEPTLPAWLPGEDKIAFFGMDGGVGGIYTVRPDGSEVTLGTAIGPNVQGLIYSRNSLGVSSDRRYISCSPYPYLEGAGLRVWDRVTNQVHHISNIAQNPNFHNGIWSPTGSKLLAKDGATGRLATFRPDGSEYTLVTENVVEFAHWKRGD